MIYKKEDFRIVFMGTPDFAVLSLSALVDNGFNVVGVVTVADKPAGRGKQLSQSAVKKYALEHNLPLLQPIHLRAASFLEELKNWKAHLQIIVAFRMLPREVWEMPPLGSINLHASLLPMYRGAAPINWAVINNEKETGVSTFFLKHEIDTGNLLFQEKITIDKEDNAGTLHDKLMHLGANLLLKTINAIIHNSYQEIQQDSISVDNLKAAPKIFKADGKIHWQESLSSIHNLIRGLSPYPCAWTELVDNFGKRITVKIFASKAVYQTHNHQAGTLWSDGHTFVKVAVNDGFVEILDLQLAGKKRMPVSVFLQGFKGITDYQCV